MTVVPSLAALGDLLSSSHAGTLTFCGYWPHLTVAVSRALADWAAQDSARGCGLYLACKPDPRCSGKARDNGSVYQFCDGEEAAERRWDGQTRIAADDLAARLLNPNLAPPAGVALTGHGAEYCIRFGSRWMSTFRTDLLSGPIVIPSGKLASVVFLNGCASLRLGDSCVPEHRSMARLLFGRGAAVIGSFRNFQTSPLFGEVFADALLQGMPFGRIVNRLNQEACSQGAAIATFQLLGDPSRCCPVGTGTLRRAPTRPARLPAGAVGSVEELIDHAGCLERIAASIDRWMPDLPELPDPRNWLIRSADRAGRAVHATRFGAVDAEELQLVAHDLEQALDAMQVAILSATARYVQEKGWIQAAYAPRCSMPGAAEAVCRRCGESSLRTRYEPFAAYLSAVDREECDRCGTTREAVGGEFPLDDLTVAPETGGLAIELPPLPKPARGLIFFHRMVGFTPLRWPERGGTKLVAAKQLRFGGRLTLVAAVVGRRCLALQYHTFFVEPDGPASGRPSPSRSEWPA